MQIIKVKRIHYLRPTKLTIKLIKIDLIGLIISSQISFHTLC